MKGEPMSTSTVRIAGLTITLEHDNPGVDVRLTPRTGEEAGIEYLDVRVTCEEPARPGRIDLAWEYPLVNTHHRATTMKPTELCAFGRPRVNSSATTHAPVWGLHDIAGNNRLTFALADAINATEQGAKVIEETACANCHVSLFCAPVPPLTEYSTTVRFDARPLPYHDTMRAVSDWWAAMPAYTPAAVPEHARLPMYSTWYSFHLGITPEAIERQCKLARALGMQSVIVDDGWQTEDKNRGYAYCGDWEAASGKFPDFRAHVDRVHAIGMKYLLWFSVPFVGVHTKAYERFRDKFLNPDPDGKRKWFVLDPRFPEVREYLIGVYERCLNEFDLDGFKLDFVDCFRVCEETRDEFGNGRDYASVADAADRLLTDVMARLRALKPDVMIEFRQAYIGPVMRKYGNIFRVGDEPNNFAGNRIHSMSLRALCGNTAVHSDMVMWHPDDTVESAAMQLIHALFTVPQISVKLDTIPESHVAMIRRYLAFWREHRDVLLDGRIQPLQPQHAYPAVISETDAKVAAAAYANGFVPLPAIGTRALLVVNGTMGDRVVIESPEALGERRVRVWSCTGECVLDETRELAAGLHALPLPPAGTASVELAPGR